MPEKREIKNIKIEKLLWKRKVSQPDNEGNFLAKAIR